MLETNSWIYLDLEKTGCTFLRSKLIGLFPDSEFTNTEKHMIQNFKSSRIKILTIRDPFNYYFSLWSYGLEKRGGFYHQINRINPSVCQKFYGKKNIYSFESFLDFALNHTARYPFLYERWLPNGFDIYSTRVLSMLIPMDERAKLSSKIKEINKISEFNKLIIDLYKPEIILKTETLNSDFHYLVKKGMMNFLNLPTQWIEAFPISAKPINSSNISSKLEDSNKKKFISKKYLDLIYKKSSISLELIKIRNDLIKQ